MTAYRRYLGTVFSLKFSGLSLFGVGEWVGGVVVLVG